MIKSKTKREKARKWVVMGKTIFNSSTEGRAIQDTSDQGQQSSSNSLPSTTEQLYNLLESKTTSSMFSFGFIAQKCNFLE